MIDAIKTHKLSLDQLYQAEGAIQREIKHQRVLADDLNCQKAVEACVLPTDLLQAAAKEWGAEDCGWEDMEAVVECLTDILSQTKLPDLLVVSTQNEYRCCSYDLGAFCAVQELGQKYFDGTVYLWAPDPKEYYFCNHCVENSDHDFTTNSSKWIFDQLRERQIEEIHAKELQDYLRLDQKRQKLE